MRIYTEEQKEARRIQVRECYQRNIEKRRAYDRFRYQRDRAKRDAASKEWAETNRDKMREFVRKSMMKNRNKYAAKASLWKKKNHERVNAYSREWRKRNTERHRASVLACAKKKPWLSAEAASLRRARLRMATPPWVDRVALKAIFKKSHEITKATGILHEVDHIYPLVHKKLNGLHVPWNLQILTASDNSRKHNKLWV